MCVRESFDNRSKRLSSKVLNVLFVVLESFPGLGLKAHVRWNGMRRVCMRTGVGALLFKFLTSSLRSFLMTDDVR